MVKNGGQLHHWEWHQEISFCCLWLFDTLTRVVLYFRFMLKKSSRKSARRLMDKAQRAVNKCYQNKICPLNYYSSSSCYFITARRQFFFLFTSRHLFIGLACFKYVFRCSVINFVSRDTLHLRDVVYHTSLPTNANCLQGFFSPSLILR